MHLFHLVLAGVFIGASANDYVGGEFDQLQSREESDPTQRRTTLQRVRSRPNEINDSDSIDDWVTEPRTPRSKPTRSTPEWLDPLNLTTPNPKAWQTSPSQVRDWSLDLKRALDKLAESVKELHTAVNDLTPTRSVVPLRGKLPRRRRDKRDVETTSRVPVETEGSANTSASDGGRGASDATTEAIQNGRRSGHDAQSSVVRDKLLSYLDEGFDEVRRKVDSLAAAKRRFSSVAPYRIGYIVANVDTLAVSVRNLRELARSSRLVWGERKILEVYDRLRISNTLLANLLDTLRLLMENK
ncbi:unnamed protein product, partial [Iphiclides podalirius]